MKEEVIRAFLSFLLCVVLVLLITVVNFYYFMNHHFVSYCEEIVNQAGQQIESVLHKMEVFSEPGAVAFLRFPAL